MAIVESVQWFEKKMGSSRRLFEQGFSEHIFHMLDNDKISKETKGKLINRIIEITKEISNKMTSTKKYKSYFIDGKGTIVDKKLLELDNAMYSFKLKRKFYENHEKSDYPSSGDKTPDYDWEKMTNQFVEEVKRKQTIMTMLLIITTTILT